ncbi:MAG: hypothetical protein N2C14_13625, partial [Planctomycetales bacterium]
MTTRIKNFPFATGLLLCGLALTFGLSQTCQANVPELVGKLALLSDEEVAAQLDLSEQTASRLKSLVNRRIDDGGTLLLEVKDLSPEEQEQKLAPYRKESEELGRKLLSAAEWNRLEELRIQQLGMLSMQESEIAGKLGLSPDQIKDRDQLLAERVQALVGASTSRQRAIRAEYDRKLRNLLSDEQFMAWQSLAGESIATPTQLVSAATVQDDAGDDSSNEDSTADESSETPDDKTQAV